MHSNLNAKKATDLLQQYSNSTSNFSQYKFTTVLFVLLFETIRFERHDRSVKRLNYVMRHKTQSGRQMNIF